MSTTADSKYAFLTQFDTVFLIDDSGSMAGRSWREIKKAFSAITPIYTAHDADGIDIYFINHRNTKNAPQDSYANIKITGAVDEIFDIVTAAKHSGLRTVIQKAIGAMCAGLRAHTG
jgi:hypothetical protein